MTSPSNRFLLALGMSLCVALPATLHAAVEQVFVQKVMTSEAIVITEQGEGFLLDTSFGRLAQARLGA